MVPAEVRLPAEAISPHGLTSISEASLPSEPALRFEPALGFVRTTAVSASAPAPFVGNTSAVAVRLPAGSPASCSVAAKIIAP
jgi:hypothetical protein